MRRPAENRAHRSGFDDASGIHDGDAIGGFGDDAEVVRDEQQRQVERRLHLAQQVENLRLNRDIERRRGLVGDDERRPTRERDGDHHALAHAARKLVRVVRNSGFGIDDSHGAEELDRLCVRFASRGASVDQQRLGDLIADAEHRVERRHRLLEDQRDLRAAHRLHVAIAERQQIASFEAHATAGDPSRRLHEAHDRQRGHRFAAARFADEPERLALVDRKAHIVHRGHRRARAEQPRGARRRWLLLRPRR